MNTEHIKKYAPKARKAFINAVTQQATKYGISNDQILPMQQQGDLVIIGDHTYPRFVIQPREQLIQQIQQQGFDQVMEQAAYSWFNRLCAIRYMELKGFLDHGYRVLSHPDSDSGFQILDECLEVELPGLDTTKVRSLKLEGTKDEELYRELLLAQCHALHKAMPFLFETVDDATELLLPGNLTKTDSLIQDLVTTIPEDNWQDIEIIGWLYQFYISEKKDEVIGKVVKSEDIPAATQLFTPNWIVKYMVQNSLGAQWLATYPQSPIKAQMEYYIEPAQQTAEVNQQLADITPSQINPEELTLIDPACGSGHILVEAYELFKAIYLERGYRLRDVPKLILEKNLYGLDIDQRAVQLTIFALMMKGREDNRRLFERGIQLNVLALQDSTDFDPEILIQDPLVSKELEKLNITSENLYELKNIFESTTTFGSLIRIPKEISVKIQLKRKLCCLDSQDLFVKSQLERLMVIINQASILSDQYDSVVANPPYMGSGYMTAKLKNFVEDEFSNSKGDLYACFFERGNDFTPITGSNTLITQHSWMFLPKFKKFRKDMVDNMTLTSLVHLGVGAFDSISGEVVKSVIFSSRRDLNEKYIGKFINIESGDENKKRRDFLSGNYKLYKNSSENFKKIPGYPISYWISEKIRNIYINMSRLKDFSSIKQGIKTGDNSKFLRFWQEVSIVKVGINRNLEEDYKWVPCTKGGTYRKWYGNYEYILNWENNGHDLRNFFDDKGKLRSRPQNTNYFFTKGITWSGASSSCLSTRVFPEGFAFESKGSVCFPFRVEDAHKIKSVLNSCVAEIFFRISSPNLDYSEGAVSDFPIPNLDFNIDSSQSLIKYAKIDWDSYERSWDFQTSPLIQANSLNIEGNYDGWRKTNITMITHAKSMEEDNNRIFLKLYDLEDELIPDTSIDNITFTVNPAYRYSGKKSGDDDYWQRFRKDSMKELISYSVGCIMGRYSLDSPGLIYAHGGNIGFDSNQYSSFRADDDGIIPITDTDWFSDDACNRVIEFISIAWPVESLEENLIFLADNLNPKKGEDSRRTIRRYLSDQFFKDHLSTYKNRPMYWLFSSGKNKSFQCLVYLHRYNEGTLARMRTEYVMPLIAKLTAYLSELDKDIAYSSSTAEIKKLERQRNKLFKQQAELSIFEEKLRHYSDQRISLDLDDGVKVNYGKFGDLVAGVKEVTGKPPQKVDIGHLTNIGDQYNQAKLEADKATKRDKQVTATNKSSGSTV